jgi:UDP-N-acetylglucosamine:LPS N-acetylglucosamine transferase
VEKKVLILTSDTGGGHTSAARALEAGLTKVAEGVNFLVHTAHALEECSAVTRAAGNVYNFLLRSHQKYVKYYHRFINRYHPEQWVLIERYAKPYLERLFDKHCPNLIVSVHPMLQYPIARILHDLNLRGKIPFVTVVTDPCGNSWRAWSDAYVDLYIVAHERAKAELLEYGVEEHRIRVIGMPIHPKFQEVNNLDPGMLRKELGLDPEKFTVFVNAGWIGGGNIPRIYRSLVAADLDLQVVFLTGKNARLADEARTLARQARFPVKVLGFSNHMERLMRASDVMVSKLGGLTTFEALATRLPIIADAVTPPMPQEAGTGVLLEEHNAGLMLRRAEDIVPTLRQLLDTPSRLKAMREAAAALGVPDATQRIVNELSALVPASS